MEKDFVRHVREQWALVRPEVDTSPMDVIARIHRLGIYLRREILTVYKEFGLGEGEFDILATIRRNGAPFEMHPTELSKELMITSGGISKQLDRLEAAGHISREKSEHDGRSRTVSLTPAGLDVIDRAYVQHMENEHRLISSLSPESRQVLANELAGWLDKIEREGKLL